MMNNENYYQPVKKVYCRLTRQGSRFIGLLEPVKSISAIQLSLEKIKKEYTDATHHTFAMRIGSGVELIERASDDREPSGTAGQPILQMMQAQKVSDALLVVVRYFGGTKLGIGGLKRAYRDCAKLSLEEAALRKVEPLERYSLAFLYEDMGTVSRLIESAEGIISAVKYSDQVNMQVTLPSRNSEAMLKNYQTACRGRGIWQKNVQPNGYE